MRHLRMIAPVLACAMTASASMHAQAAGREIYELDPVHTRVMFAVSHAGFSNAIGTVPGSTGTLVFDRDDWRSARLYVRVPLARLDLGDAKWNAAVLAANLLDGARHPEARFVSDTAEPTDAEHAKVCGRLTLREVTRPLCLDVTLNALKRHPMPPFRRTAGFSATATLSRSEYGIDAWKSVIGDTVELRIEAEAVRSARAGPGAEDPATPAPQVPAAEAVNPEPAEPAPVTDPSAPALPEPVPPDPIP